MGLVHAKAPIMHKSEDVEGGGEDGLPKYHSNGLKDFSFVLKIHHMIFQSWTLCPKTAKYYNLEIFGAIIHDFLYENIFSQNRIKKTYL